MYQDYGTTVSISDMKGFTNLLGSFVHKSRLAKTELRYRFNSEKFLFGGLGARTLSHLAFSARQSELHCKPDSLHKNKTRTE